MTIPNVLADRYASSAMLELFDPTNRVRLERRFWIAVLAAQIESGLEVDRSVLADYEAVVENIDLESIRRREQRTRHDVKARLDEFCELAGHEHLHKGLTSRDATENVEQLLTYQALRLVRGRAIALTTRIAERAAEFAAVAIVGRTHNVPAQPTTVGKRLAQFGEELMGGIERLDDLLDRFALRGIKGPVGSQQDQLDLLGSASLVMRLETSVAEHLGVSRVLNAVGQVYPRSLDFDVVTCLSQLSAGPANLALLVRLMAGHDLATEGFRPGQVGSSAMPHKMNSRSCERVNGFAVILKGHVTMAAGLSGDQWNEGDVSCSVVRRVVLPDAFFAVDGLLETSLSVVKDLGIFPHVVEAELQRYLPFLATPTLLMFAVRNAMGREVAHEIIKEHAVGAALAMRDGSPGADLVDRLAGDERFPGTKAELQRLMADPSALLGLIDAQVQNFVGAAQVLAATDPVAAAYRGGDIL
ncbi:MAG: adenylosuccinate lyase [Actinomycetota bacterium]|nr:adenylosuccinate lyase [Actinomycetota bacterium]